MSDSQPRPGATGDPRRETTVGPRATRPGPATGDVPGTPGRSADVPHDTPTPRSPQPAGTAQGRTAPTDAERSTAEKKKGGRPTAEKPASDWGTFRAVVIAVGVILVAVGAYFLITGTHGLPDAATGPFDPTLESQFRFFAAQQIGVGGAFIAIAVKFQWVTVLWLVCMMVFFGGVGRVLSWALVGGTPHWLMIVLMILELAFPAALLVWHRWITKTVDLKRSLAAGR